MADLKDAVEFAQVDNTTAVVTIPNHVFKIIVYSSNNAGASSIEDQESGGTAIILFNHPLVIDAGADLSNRKMNVVTGASNTVYIIYFKRPVDGA